MRILKKLGKYMNSGTRYRISLEMVDSKNKRIEIKKAERLLGQLKMH